MEIAGSGVEPNVIPPLTTSPPSSAKNRPMKFPWNDPRGQFSPFKTAVLASLFLPLLWVIYLQQSGELGPRVLNALMHEIGLWTIRLLFLSLAITPVMQMLRWPRLLLVRRMIGVAAFAYVALHLLLYFADQAFNLWTVATEIVLRIYLTIGFLALLGLLALAATSTDRMVRRLGGVRWTKLHRLTYPIALLAVIHHFMQSKVNVDQPMIMSGLFIWLMAWRLVAWQRGARRPVPIWVAVALSLMSGVLTALGEALYYWLKLGAPPTRLLQATLAIDVAIRPAWWVLGITLALSIVGAIRMLQTQNWKLQPRTA
jgi:methionine sulfoxide reductase heme-binding subunit